MMTSVLLGFWDFVLIWIPYVLALVVCIVTGIKVNKRIQYVGENEQLVLKQLTKKIVINGPAVHFPSYFSTLSFKKRKGISLNATQYVKIQDDSSGKVHIIKGPQNYLLGAQEEVVEGPISAHVLSGTQYIVVKDVSNGSLKTVKGPCTFFKEALEEVADGPNSAFVLSSTEYLVVKSVHDGSLKTVKGPCTYFPGVFDEIKQKAVAISLRKTQYAKVENTLTGVISIERGEKLLFLDAYQKQLGSVQSAYTLKNNHYVRLKDALTGKTRVERGPGVIFPGPHETVLECDGGVQSALDLKSWEYCVMHNTMTGEVLVHRGQQLVWPGPHEMHDGKRTAITVDTDHAALIQDRNTGCQTLITKPQMFVPEAHQTIEGIRTIIRLADNEAMILKDEEGKYHIRFGDPSKGTERAFFLPPFWEVVSLRWSRGRRREKRDLAITRFDCRPQYMSFEFNCRTADNVEMILEGTFFWEVVDIAQMLQYTGDAPGDVCSHARSCFIELISKVTLAEFMETFNQIATKAHSEDDTFYATRGIKIHSLEVTKYECADSRTSEILEQVIMETTNRMNRLSCQESENEVALAQLHGSLEHEKKRTEVLKIQHEHAIEAARTEGQAEAERCLAFFKAVEGASDIKGSVDLANELWHANKKAQMLETVSTGNAQVYFTPQDANITVHSK